MNKVAKLSETKVYAGRLKNKENLLSSSSGGAFTALSNLFLEQGSAVICSIYNYDSHCPEFCLITDVENRDRAKGSKYVQSTMGNIYIQAERWLESNPNKNILFIGTGCQAEGFRKYVEQRKLRERCLIVDIICHGVPSPSLWKAYVSEIEKIHNGKIEYVTFKDKRNGWLCPTAFVQINNKERLITDYVRFYFSEVPLRPSCYSCPFTKIGRETDLTIGDFWHIEEKKPEFYDPSGTSLFLVHTEMGEMAFTQVKKDLIYIESNTEECWQINLERPSKLPANRQEVFDACIYNGVYETIMKLHHERKNSIPRRILNKMKKLWKGQI